MRKAHTLAVVGVLGIVTVAAFVLGQAMLATRVSAQASRSFHVLTVPTGGATCRDMTGNPPDK
jgi:hypothetical protein